MLHESATASALHLSACAKQHRRHQPCICVRPVVSVRSTATCTGRKSLRSGLLFRSFRHMHCWEQQRLRPRLAANVSPCLARHLEIPHRPRVASSTPHKPVREQREGGTGEPRTAIPAKKSLGDGSARACRACTGSSPAASSSQRRHASSPCTASLVRNSSATRSKPRASLHALPGTRLTLAGEPAQRESRCAPARVYAGIGQPGLRPLRSFCALAAAPVSDCN